MLVSNAVICDVNGEREVDIRIEDGIITEMGSNLSDSETIDAKGLYFMPLLVDTNVRLQDSILNSKNIKIISDEALSGGIGEVV
ncbi:MAG: dihydroorotase, partial [Sulfurimonas sp.]|nr:dihydroorotase [Sulfurimonas sp.]